MATETSAWMNRMMTTPMNAARPYSCTYACDVAASVPFAVSVNSQNPRTISAATTDCGTEAMGGLRYLWCVRPSAVGSTRSRPSEYRYRAVVLWNAMPHAN